MIENPLPSQEAPFLILCGIVMFYAFSRYVAGSRLHLFVRSFLNENLVDQQIRQERSFAGTAVFAFLSVIAILSAFLASALPFFDLLTDFSYLGRFVSIVVCLLLLTTFRSGIYAFLTWLLDLNQLHQYHSFHWLLNNYLLALVLLPTSIFIEFGPSSFKEVLAYSGVGLILLLYAFRVGRFALLSTTAFRVPWAYNFLYICALEISPLMLVIAMISGQWAS